MSALPWTAVLVGVSTILSFVIGTVVGIIVGSRRRLLARGDSAHQHILLRDPLLLVRPRDLVPARDSRPVVPSFRGYSSTSTIGWNWPFLQSAAYHAVLPAFTIVASSIAGWLLGMRNMMIVTLNEDYIILAEAKGLSKARISFVYAARNAYYCLRWQASLCPSVSS